MERTATLTRNTSETRIELTLALDGGPTEISTGIGFFDHMLLSFARHSGFGLCLQAEGDVFVDCHHTIEDVGIVLGLAVQTALSDRAGIKRYGQAVIPMDEAQAECVLDISGRPYLLFDATFLQERVGDFDSCMAEEFFRAFADNSGITLHLRCKYGKNAHHMIEAMFKAFAHAMRRAVAKSGSDQVLSAKGSLSVRDSVIAQ